MFGKSDLLTLETIVYGWDIFVSIDAGVQVIIFYSFLFICRPCVVIVDYWDRLCTLGRAPRTKETLPDFCECCRVTRHS